jgi:hypothetical protein
MSACRDVLAVEPSDTHNPLVRRALDCLETVANIVPRFLMGAIGLDRMREKNAGASQSHGSHY